MSERTQLTPELCLELWYRAAKEELGLLIPIIDPTTSTYIQNRLYDARKDIGDPRLQELTCHLNADGKTILIYRKYDNELP